jgi:hypothetical protein
MRASFIGSSTTHLRKWSSEGGVQAVNRAAECELA